jgi:hypothetical protein
MKNFMNSIQVNKPKKNSFDLSHDVKMSASMGNLIPILALPCVPGDRHTLGCESLIRFAPLVAPIMHRVDVSMHYFFVPNRLVWKNWESFATDANSGFAKPYVANGASLIDSTGPLAKFMDYMGVPPNATDTVTNINALPFAAYQCIYSNYYRDQNLIAPIDYQLKDGANTDTADLLRLLTMRKRAWEHDYFTSCLPFAQKGSAVDLPLGTVDIPYLKIQGNTTSGSNYNIQTTVGGTGNNYNVEAAPAPLGNGFLWSQDGSYDVTPTTINDLRRAFSLQRWLEANARSGTRYIENLWARWFVKSSDARLQRPEYITGVKTPVIISEVLNTTGETSGLPQGNMAGHGISVSSGKSGSYFCEEHGYIIGIMSVMPKTAYQQGIPRDFRKFDTLDDLQPEFANIGEQEVFQDELYAYTNNAQQTFGYIPRYSEYRYMPSRVAGDFRTTLDFWHLGRIFGTEPALSQSFIECKPSDTTRIFAVEDGTDPLYCHIYNKIQSVRPLPKYGTPQSY